MVDPMSATYLAGSVATQGMNSAIDCGSVLGNGSITPNGNSTPAIVEVISVASRNAECLSHVRNVGQGNRSESVNCSKPAINRKSRKPQAYLSASRFATQDLDESS